MVRQSEAQNEDGQIMSCTSRCWLPGKRAGLLVLSLVMLAALALIGSASAQDGSESALASDPWAAEFCLAPQQCELGDFNGDRKTDILAFCHNSSASPCTSGRVEVRLSDGYSFKSPSAWQTNFCTGSSWVCKVGDFNGDGSDDIIAFQRGTSPEVRVALSNRKDGFGTSAIWNDYFCYGNQICDVGDFNGDHLDDIVAFARSSEAARKGDVYVGINDGQGGFNANGTNRVSGWFCIDQQICGTGDFNGDGHDDVITFQHGPCYTNSCSGQVWVATANGSRTLDGLEFLKNDNNGLWKSGPFCVVNPSSYLTTYKEVCGVGDFNGDGYDDIINYLRSAWTPNKIGQVDVALSTGASFGGTNTWGSFCIGDQVCGTGNYYEYGTQSGGISQYNFSQVSRTGNFNGDPQRQDDVVAFLRSTELGGVSPKPGWVYVKVASGPSFIDPPPPPKEAWILSMIVRLTSVP